VLELTDRKHIVRRVHRVRSPKLFWAARKIVLAGSLLLSCSLAPAQSRPAITGISHVIFYSDNIAQSREFYGTLLGWLPVPATSSAPGLRFYANHAQYVELLTPPGPGQPDRLDLVAFETKDAEGLRAYLAARGMAVPAAVTLEQDGSRSFQVRDPEQNLIEFTQMGKTPLPSPAPGALGRRLSTHILHAGYVVRDRAALDHFYRDLLGFHLYWQGGAKPGDVDWVMMQVPDGTDWIEYMLNLPAHPTAAQLGSANHIAPGVAHVADLQRRLEQRGWQAPAGRDPKVLGVDGKLQLDLHDPDGTRIEFMEFLPIKTPCCSPYTGRQPVPETGW
jgi:catechol 2,3-dioxygenase-like lactoylglutathione lyase family enzyme